MNYWPWWKPGSWRMAALTVHRDYQVWDAPLLVKALYAPVAFVDTLAQLHRVSREWTAEDANA